MKIARAMRSGVAFRRFETIVEDDVLRVGTVRVAILNMTAGGMSGGYRKYLTNMIPRLASSPEVEALLCASPPMVTVEGWVGQIPKVRHIVVGPYDPIGYMLGSRSTKDVRKQLDFFSPDVIFIPVDRYVPYSGAPIVNMIRNMEPLVDGVAEDPFVGWLKKRIQCMDAKAAVEKSDRIIAISEFVRDHLVDRWNVPQEKISLVYHGGNDPVEAGKVPALEAVPASWTGKFLFTAGSIRPARGMEDLLWAMKYLSTGETDVRGLVVAGDTSSEMARYKVRLQEWARAQGLSSRVFWAGGLDESGMAWCYKNCSAFVMTSRVESFGMIALEAMSYGCVCVAADNPCLPEIFGDAAVYYKPKDVNSLVEAISTLLGWDAQRRAEMSRRAKARSGRFSWDIAAEKTIGVLKMAMNARRGAI